MSVFIKIGKTQKPHSIKGELKLKIEDRFVDTLFEQEALFLQIKGQHVPYFIDELREGNTLIIKLEDIDTRSHAEPLAHKDIYLRRNDIKLSDEEIKDTGLRYQFLEGFTLIDEEIGTIGIIEEVAEFPQQEMAYVTYNAKVCLIPLHNHLVKEIKKEEKEIIVDLPEGLLEVFFE